MQRQPGTINVNDLTIFEKLLRARGQTFAYNGKADVYEVFVEESPGDAYHRMAPAIKLTAVADVAGGLGYLTCTCGPNVADIVSGTRVYTEREATWVIHSADNKMRFATTQKTVAVRELRALGVSETAVAKIAKVTVAELSELVDSSSEDTQETVQDTQKRTVTKKTETVFDVKNRPFSAVDFKVCAGGRSRELIYTLSIDVAPIWQQINAQIDALCQQPDILRINGNIHIGNLVA